MRYVIFLDESGDLGFNFSEPYLHGGSSRYLTIASIIIPEHKVKILDRIIRGFYKNRQRSKANELKSVHLSSKEKQQFITIIIQLKSQHPDIVFCSITIDKKRVKNTLRLDSNALYNYAVKQLLLEKIINLEFVDLIPDARCEKNNSRWNFSHYFQQMLLEKSLETSIINQSCNITMMGSHSHFGLQFVDYYVALVWAEYEFSKPNLAEFYHLENVENRLLFT